MVRLQDASGLAHTKRVAEMTSKTLGLWQAILAGLQFFSGAAAMAEWVDPKSWALFVVIVGAAQAGTAVYTGKVAQTPADFPNRPHGT